MEFFLKYDGKLKPNDRADGKQKIREYIRPQLENLWKTVPLDGAQDLLEYPARQSGVSVIKEIQDIKFAPLVTSAIALRCELDIIFLWKDEQGNIINSGDIDNRLKTLFDALSCPNLNQVINPDDLKKHTPYHVLLEDDKLITSVKVHTNHLLLHEPKDDDVSILIKVTTKQHKALCCNAGL
jgi:hypothetical protein